MPTAFLPCAATRIFGSVRGAEFTKLATATIRAVAQGVVIETGETKGQRKDISRAEFYQLLGKSFAVPASHVVSEYGMAELASPRVFAPDRPHEDEAVPRQGTRVVGDQDRRPLDRQVLDAGRLDAEVAAVEEVEQRVEPADQAVR